MRRALLGLLLWFVPLAAQAETSRYALIIGNNRGDPSEVELSYAEVDAKKVAAVLERLGGVKAENSVLLLGRSASEIRAAALTVNDRVRQEVHDGSKAVVLFVYYSGHSDQHELHLGPSRLAVDELRKLVRGSAATLRVLVLDSCRSGALTRVKGGRPAPGFDIALENTLDSEGVAFITSSALFEDAQESDAIGGSFFTHFFTSGLMGAADESSDGQVSLTEAFEYARAQTVKATSRTWAGTQHPTFQYDFKGKGDVALTDLTQNRPDRAALVFSAPGEYLVFRAGEGPGRLVTEVVTERPGRRILLEPGRYFVRERRNEELREGSIELPASASVPLDTSGFARVQYARLVRKGTELKTVAHGPSLAYLYRGEILKGLGGMSAISAAYELALPWLTLGGRATFGQATAHNALVSSTTRELSLSIEVHRALDVGPLTLAAGLVAGVAYMGQRFESAGKTPARDALAFQFGGQAKVSAELVFGLSLFGLAELRSYVFRSQHAFDGTSLATPLTYALGGGVGVAF